MKSIPAHLAKKSNYAEFLSKGIDNDDLTSIRRWIQTKLIDSKTKAQEDTVIAFFGAEGALVRSYIKNNEIDKLKKLVDVFRDFKNAHLESIEFSLLANIITMENDQLSTNKTEAQSLQIVWESFKDFADEHPSQKSTWEKISSLLGDHIHDYGYE